MLRDLVEKALQATSSEKPPKGYTRIPGGTKGGYRKLVGGKYDYWYPESHRKRMRANISEFQETKAEERASDEIGLAERKKARQEMLRKLRDPKVAAKRIWSATKHTIEDFPKAVKAIGRLSTGQKLQKGDLDALASVGVTVATTALVGATGGAAAGAGIFVKKLAIHAAAQAVSQHAARSYTGIAGGELAEKVATYGPLLFKAQGMSEDEQAVGQKYIEELLMELRKVLSDMSDADLEAL